MAAPLLIKKSRHLGGKGKNYNLSFWQKEQEQSKKYNIKIKKRTENIAWTIKS